MTLKVECRSTNAPSLQSQDLLMTISCMIENSIVCAGAYPDAGILSVNANLEDAKEHFDKGIKHSLIP